jgi:hypothetical protein
MHHSPFETLCLQARDELLIKQGTNFSAVPLVACRQEMEPRLRRLPQARRCICAQMAEPFSVRPVYGRPLHAERLKHEVDRTMLLRMISIIALSSSLIGEARVVAQPTTEPDMDYSGESDGENFLADPDVVGPLYSDKDLMRMRSVEDMKAAWRDMSEDNRQKIRDACEDPQTQREQDLCAAVSGLE